MAHTDGKRDRYYENWLLNLDLTYAKYPIKPSKPLHETIGKIISASFKALDIQVGTGAGFEFSAESSNVGLTIGGHENPLNIHLKNGSIQLEDTQFAGIQASVFGHSIGPFYSSTRSLRSAEKEETYGVFDSVCDPIISVCGGSIYIGFGVSWDVRIDIGSFIKAFLEDMP